MVEEQQQQKGGSAKFNAGIALTMHYVNILDDIRLARKEGNTMLLLSSTISLIHEVYDRCDATEQKELDGYELLLEKLRDSISNANINFAYNIDLKISACEKKCRIYARKYKLSNPDKTDSSRYALMGEQD